MRRRYGLEIAQLTRDLIRLEGCSPVRLIASLVVRAWSGKGSAAPGAAARTGN
jgi:hypothetical protein